MRSSRSATSRSAVLAIAILVTVSVTSVPATLASPPSDATGDLAIAGPRGGFQGEGLITAEPNPHQLATGVIRPDRSVWFDVSLRNVGGSLRTFVLHGTGDGDGFVVRYYDDDHVEITGDVVAGTLQVPLDAGRRTSMLIELVAPLDADTDDAKTVWLRSSALDAGAQDLVRVRVSVPPRRVWAVAYDGRTRCTATFPHRVLEPGKRTGVTVTLTNITDETITVSPYWASMVFRDGDGDRLGDSIPPPFSGPAPAPVDLRPGGSVRVHTWDAVVRWSGPMSIKVGCTGGRFNMPPATFEVAVPTPQDTVAEAIDAAVDVPGSPWQSCRPGPAGEPATGVLSTPLPSEIPDITVRCWASVRREAGFDVVALHLVSPDDAPAYTLGEDDPSIDPEPSDDAPNYLAVRWGFVVTADVVRGYSSGSQVKALGKGKRASYALSNGRWRKASHGRCGYWGFSWWPTGSGVLIDWIAGCVQTPERSSSPQGGSHLERVGGRFVLTRRAE